MFPNDIKLKINDQEEIPLTEEEFEDIAWWLKENKYWISNISYSFPGFDCLNVNMDPTFTEHVIMVGNTADWSYGDDNRS